MNFMPMMMGGMQMPSMFQPLPLSMMSVKQIKSALKQQGKETSGDKEALLQRLMGGGLATQPKKKQKKNKVPLTEEQLAKLPEEHRNNYLKKQAQKKENLIKQQAMLEEHAQQAHERQVREVVVKIDLSQIKQQIESSMASYGGVEAIKYDSLKNQYVVRFNDLSSARSAQASSTLSAPREATVNATVKISPQVVGKKTVFFIDPSHVNHPQKETVDKVLTGQGVALRWPAKESSQVFINKAQEAFSRFGKISGVFREKGFICVTFTTQKAAKNAASTSSNKAELFGVQLGAVQVGIPKKSDKKNIGKRKREDDDE